MASTFGRPAKPLSSMPIHESPGRSLESRAQIPPADPLAVGIRPSMRRSSFWQQIGEARLTCFASKSSITGPSCNATLVLDKNIHSRVCALLQEGAGA